MVHIEFEVRDFQIPPLPILKSDSLGNATSLAGDKGW
jgi:hypothetical protein